MKIEIETFVRGDLDTVWDSWTTPADICSWNAASDDWHTPSAQLELRPGGAFSYRMEARDGSVGFDFAGTFTRVDPKSRIDFELEDARPVSVRFEPGEDGVKVRQSFTAEDELSAEQQRAGWQSILDRFARHVESKGRS